MREIKSIQRTKEEWTARYQVPKYQPNLEISGEYDENLAARCENGVFVGKMEDDVRVWKGIPYSKQPVDNRRFERASSPEPSDKVFEAFYFGKTCLQPFDDNERASQYEQGEENQHVEDENFPKCQTKKRCPDETLRVDIGIQHAQCHGKESDKRQKAKSANYQTAEETSLYFAFLVFNILRNYPFFLVLHV